MSIASHVEEMAALEAVARSLQAVIRAQAGLLELMEFDESSIYCVAYAKRRDEKIEQAKAALDRLAKLSPQFIIKE